MCKHCRTRQRPQGLGNGAAQSSGVEKPVLKNTAARLRAFRQQSKRENNLEYGGGVRGVYEQFLAAGRQGIRKEQMSDKPEREMGRLQMRTEMIREPHSRTVSRTVAGSGKN